jgi:hypothetical protein
MGNREQHIPHAGTDFVERNASRIGGIRVRQTPARPYIPWKLAVCGRRWGKWKRVGKAIGDLSQVRGDWGWHAREDTETRALDGKDVVDGTTTVSLLFQPFKLTRDALAFLPFILLPRAQ